MRRVVVMGVAGCGKSTVGAAVAERIEALYLDGDDLHPEANIAKMSRGEPLTDDDRAPWLDEVGRSLQHIDGITLIGCSALKRLYRDRIRTAAGTPVAFLHLAGTRAVIAERMARREGHFMPLSLLDSQFAALEPLQNDETGLTVDIDRPFDDLVAAIAAAFDGQFSRG